MAFFPFLFLALFIFFLPPSTPSPFRGIPPQDMDYYLKGTMWCKDGSKSFSAEQLNDDYCDCADGTDEPGTSACPNGRFYCQNKGYTPLWIFSSRVNDGICDCCDGSDEYDGKENCVNTCSQAGKVWRDTLKKKISTVKAGLKIRKQNIENGKLMITKEKVELADLKLEEKRLKDIVKKLDAKKQAIEKAEEKERLLREKEEKERRDAESEKEKKEELENQTTEFEAENKEFKVDEELEEQIHSSKQDTNEDLSREELGRLVASRWTGEHPTLGKEELVEQKHDHLVEEDGDEVYMHKDDISANVPEEQVSDGEDAAAADDDDDEEEEEEERASDGEDAVPDDDDDDEEHEDADTIIEYSSSDKEISRAKPTLWSRIKWFFESFSDIFIFHNQPLDKAEADQIRKEYHKWNAKLSDIRTKISDLEKKLDQDFGKDGEFYSFYGKCFELQEKKYTYKVCPYKHGLQMEGHSSTTLGVWDGFKDDYKSMRFAHGDRCWNGPDRSLKVQLRCGTKIELRDVDEPSRCEYVAELSTPAVCLTETLEALQEQLDNQGSTSHDEL